MKIFFPIAVILAVSTMLQGCMIGYLAKQGVAQMRVLTQRRPIDEIFAGLSPEDQERIRLIMEAKSFAREQLGLPVDGVYETYSGAYSTPIWNISACPKDSLQPYTWRYPVLGRLPYIGFYDQNDADKEQARLLELDLDVMMYGAGAFSSLGWFSDPIVPSMLRYHDSSLVNLVIHESSHRYLFIRGATDFNESFASFVGDYGTIAFFAARDGKDHESTRRAEGERRDARVFEHYTVGIIEEIATLYARPDLSRKEKITMREPLFVEAQRGYAGLPLETDTYDWFTKKPLDNARLLALRRYGRQETFDRLFERCDGDLLAAMKVAKDLDSRSVPRKERKKPPFERLERWLESDAACIASSHAH